MFSTVQVALVLELVKKNKFEKFALTLIFHRKIYLEFFLYVNYSINVTNSKN
jgi:hypothetical protein